MDRFDLSRALVHWKCIVPAFLTTAYPTATELEVARAMGGKSFVTEAVKRETLRKGVTAFLPSERQSGSVLS
jgi:hypothetical protein